MFLKYSVCVHVREGEGVRAREKERKKEREREREGEMLNIHGRHFTQVVGINYNVIITLMCEFTFSLKVQRNAIEQSERKVCVCVSVCVCVCVCVSE